MSYPFDIVTEAIATGSIPTTPASPYTEVVLPDGPGTYIFLGLTVYRSAGAASASVQPGLLTDDTDVSTTFARSLSAITIPVTAYPRQSAVYLPSGDVTFKSATGKVFVGISPNVYGDTYTVVVRVRRIQ